MFEDKSFGLKMGDNSNSPFSPRVDLLRAGASLLPQLRKSAKRKAARQRQVEDRGFGLQLTDQAMRLQNNIASQKNNKAQLGLSQNRQALDEKGFGLDKDRFAHKKMMDGANYVQNQQSQLRQYQQGIANNKHAAQMATTQRQNEVSDATTGHKRALELSAVNNSFKRQTAQTKQLTANRNDTYKLAAETGIGYDPGTYQRIDEILGSNPNLTPGGVLGLLESGASPAQQPSFGVAQNPQQAQQLGIGLPSPQSAAQPTLGEVIDGFQFLGGNPNLEENYREVAQ